MDLNMIWFLLVAVLLIGYAILDGFDLGVGVLHLFARDGTGTPFPYQRHRTRCGTAMKSGC